MGRTRAAPRRAGAALVLIYSMWTLIYFEFHNFIPAILGGGPILRRIPLMLLVPLALLALARASKRSFYWPYVVFVSMHLLILPFAWNRGLALAGFKVMLLYFVPIVATLAVVRTPAQISTLFKLFLLSFPWYCLQGLPGGLIWWHNLLGNPDAYGPMGVMAIALGYNFSLAADQKKWQRGGLMIAALGVVALVASFARGAFLAGVSVLGIIWLRSERKGRILGQGLVVLLLVLIVAEMLFPSGAFWVEMATIAEGTEEATGASRWALWTGVGMRVFAESPIFGVGAFNTGPVAVEIVPPGAVAGRFADPRVLYNKQLHNVYVQLLAEQGIVGITLWGIMIFDFFRRLRKLRTPRAIEAWREAGGNHFNLKYISLAFEGAMVAFLVGGVFYNQVYRHWFYTLILFSLLLTEASRPRTRSRRPMGSPSPG